MPSYLSPPDQYRTPTQRPSRHTPHCDLPPEVVAKRNQRERRRVTNVNDEFSRLQRLLPSVRDRVRRVPKERLLRLAARYIRDLSLLLTADSQTGSGGYTTPPGTSPEYYPQYVSEHAQYTDVTMPVAWEAPSAPPTPSLLSSLPAFLHGGDILRMPALEDAIQGVDCTGSAPSPHLQHPLAAGGASPGGGRVHGERTDTSGSCQQHFRFLQHAGYDGSCSGVWDTSCGAPPSGVCVNLTYYTAPYSTSSPPVHREATPYGNTWPAGGAAGFGVKQEDTTQHWL